MKAVVKSIKHWTSTLNKKHRQNSMKNLKLTDVKAKCNTPKNIHLFTWSINIEPRFPFYKNIAELYMLSLILLDKIKVYVFIIQSALVEEKLKFIISFLGCYRNICVPIIFYIFNSGEYSGLPSFIFLLPGLKKFSTIWLCERSKMLT